MFLTKIKHAFFHLLNQTPWFAVILILSAQLWVYFNPTLQSLLILEGSPWQAIWPLLTTHFIHLTPAHLINNLIAFIALIILGGSHWSSRLLTNLVLISALCASLIFIFFSNAKSFVGFSAVVHGVLAYLLLRHFEEGSFKLKVLCLIGFALLSLKLILDFVFPEQSRAWLGGADLATWSHLGGVLGGLLTRFLIPHKKTLQ